MNGEFIMSKFKISPRTSRLLAYLFLFVITINVSAVTEEQLRTWFNDHPRVQIDREAKRDIVGMGRIFLPAMTNPENEPFYFVSDQYDNIIETTPMGSSTFLRPGNYFIKVGSGSEDQMITQEISIERGQTKILEPDWSTLRVRIIDEARNSYDSRFEIFDNKTAESYGIGFGVREELGEQVKTWILRPGRYKVILNGEPFNTYRDFTTVDLVEGELRNLTIVVDSVTGNMLGAGLLDVIQYKDGTRNWKLSSTIHANANISSDNSADKDNPSTRILVTTQLDNRVYYDLFPYYFSSRNIIDFGITKDDDFDTRISVDSFKLRNTFVYYLLRFAGVYSRLDLETHLFPERHFFSDPRKILIKDSEGETLKKFYDKDKLTIRPSFYPMNFKEGAGLNIRLFNTARANLNLRTGVGFRQDIYNDVYVYSGGTNDEGYEVFNEVSNTYQEGIEMSVLGNFNTKFNIGYNTIAEILIPFDSGGSNVYEWENIITLKLFKYLSLDYKINISYNKDFRDYTVIDHNLFLRFTYFLY